MLVSRGKVGAEPNENKSGTVARVVQMLRALAESEEPTSVTVLARELGLSSSTVHRLLMLLFDQGMVEIVPGTKRYGVGLEFYRLGKLAASRYGQLELARPIQEAIVEECGESCALGAYLPQERQMTFIQLVETHHPLRFAIPMHVRVPLTWGASGLAILAFLDDVVADRILRESGPSPVTGDPPPTRDEMSRRLGEIRRRGYAHSQGEKLADSVGIAAPILGDAGEAIGCLAITIPVIRFEPGSQDRLGQLAIEGAQRIASGHQPARGST